METSLLFGVLVEGLKLANNVKSQSLLNKVIKLRQEYDDEISKPENLQSDLTISRVRRELRTIASSFIEFRTSSKS